jgi:hypothetical protein
MREQGLREMMAMVALMALALGGGTGCAAFNIKSAWALAENTPMQTVVRRADAARATATNVERLMSTTGVDPDSKWVPKLLVTKADAEAVLKDVANDGEYLTLKGEKLRVVHAEAWAQILSKLCSTESKSPSLYASLSGDVHTAYADLASQARVVGKLKFDIKSEDDAADDKERASEKATHEAKKAELEAQLKKTEAEYRPKIDAFKAKLRDEAAKASPEAKKQVAAAVAVLLHAIEAAKLANGAALIGYPKAAPGLKDEVKFIVKRIAADTIEANIGTRPNLEKLVPEVKLSPVSVTIAGLSPSDLGKLKLEEAVKDIAERSKNYVVHVVLLLPFISETAEMLNLQEEVLKEAQTAVGAGSPGEDLSDISVTASIAAGKGSSKRIAVPMEACDKAAKK